MNDPGLSVRQARRGDAPGIGALMVQGRPGIPTEGAAARTALREIEARAGRFIEASLEQPDAALVMVLEDDLGRLVAWSRARRYREPEEILGPDAPPGWYLLGTNVDEAHRRQGLGSWLVRERMRWLSERTNQVYYFTSEDNTASIELHRAFGFLEVRRNLQLTEAVGGPPEGFILFRAPLPLT